MSVSGASPAEVCLVVDIDETLLNPLARWTQKINERFGWSIEVPQVEVAGGFDNLLKDHPDYATFSEFADFLRADPEMNSGLDTIDGALDALTSLCGLPRVRIVCYLTTRPVQVAAATAADLRRAGFPEAPVVARPEGVDRAHTVEWKVSELEQIAKTESGRIVVIDDNLALGRRLYERNRHESTTPIVSIVFLGPLTVSEVREQNVRSEPSHHFYVADWDEIVTIVKSYVG